MIDVILSITSFILGAIMGSFIGVVIYRVPRNMSIVKPKDSYCFECHTKLKWYDNIPIFAYIFLGGKCRYCKAKIGPFYFIIECLSAVLYLVAYLVFKIDVTTLFAFAFISILLIMAGVDYENHYIFDWNQILFAVFVVGFIVYKSIINKDFPWDNLIGGGVGFFVFLLIRIVGKLIMGQECLGMGDVILMGIAGFLLGWQGLIISLLVGSVVGCIIELTLIGTKKKSREQEIAFGPYLVLGILVAFFTTGPIINLLTNVI